MKCSRESTLSRPPDLPGDMPTPGYAYSWFDAPLGLGRSGGRKTKQD